MKPSIKKLSELEKEQILEESYEPSCIIADLAKQHGIPSRVIYDLRCKKKAASVVEIPANYGSDFVELSVNTSPKKAGSLKRAILEFNNFEKNDLFS
jgi:transposase-like protein